MKHKTEDTPMDINDEFPELPTQEEMDKIIQARRERSDKISSLMGEYLLKGYKMLSSICNTCDTILMQDKRGNLYCVACAEIDCTESAKDDPTLSETAARRQAQESQFSATNNSEASADDRYGLPTTGTTQSTPSMSRNKTQGLMMTSSASNRTCLSSLGGPSRVSAETEDNPDYDTAAKMTVDANVYDVVLESPDTSGEQLHLTNLSPQELILRDKIEWACRLLKNSKNAQRCIELSNLIKSCAESLASIHALTKLNSNKQNS